MDPFCLGEELSQLRIALIEVETVKVVIGNNALLVRVDGTLDQVRQIRSRYRVYFAAKHIE
jgi:hypothetical protein